MGIDTTHIKQWDLALISDIHALIVFRTADVNIISRDAKGLHLSIPQICFEQSKDPSNQTRGATTPLSRVSASHFWHFESSQIRCKLPTSPPTLSAQVQFCDLNINVSFRYHLNPWTSLLSKQHRGISSGWVTDLLFGLNLLFRRKLKQQPGLSNESIFESVGHALYSARKMHAAGFGVLASRWPFHSTMKDMGGRNACTP